MKFKVSLKYFLSDIKKALLIYYSIIYVILIATVILQLIFKPKGSGYMGGIEMSSVVFIFVVGLNSFKGNFKMLLANGVSRNTMFKSVLTGIAPLAGFMALVDSINGAIVSSIINYKPMFMQLYHARYAGMPPEFSTQLLSMAEGFLWMFFTYAAMAMLGFLITTLYYRMNKAVKLAVSIGVPVFLFVVLPILDGTCISSSNAPDSMAFSTSSAICT